MKRINLIPPEARNLSLYKRLRTVYFKTTILQVSIVIFVVLTLAFFATAVTSANYKLSITLKEKQLKKLEEESDKYAGEKVKIQKERDRIEAENEFLQKRVLFLKDMSNDAVKWSDVLLVFSKLTPEDLWLNKISFNKDKIVLRGVTVDNMKVSEFMRLLENSGYFKFITFNFTQKKKTASAAELVDFEVITSFNR